MRPTRRRSAAALAVLAAVVVVPSPGDVASAACAAPAVRFEDGRQQADVVRGETLAIFGNGFVKGCDDGGDPDIGCGAPLHEQPRENVELRLRVRGEATLLATSDADNVGDELGQITWSVTIPTDAPVGRATLVPDGGEPLEVRIVDR